MCCCTVGDDWVWNGYGSRNFLAVEDTPAFDFEAPATPGAAIGTLRFELQWDRCTVATYAVGPLS